MDTFDQPDLSRALFEEIGDALFLLDPDTDRLIEVNPVATRLTGFSRAELLQVAATHLFRFEAAGGRERLHAAFTRTIGFHNQDGYLLRTRGGDAWVPVNLTVSRLHVRPKPLGLIIARDDRDRRAAFNQTRRVEAELRKVLAGAPAALWSAERAPGPDVGQGWQFRYVSPLLARIAGRPADYFDHPLKWVEAVHPHDRDGYRTFLRKLFAGADPDAESVYRVRTPDGETRWVRDRLQVVRDPAGRPVRLDGCLVDITDQHEAEEAIRQSEQRFRALVEKSREGIILLDEQGVIRYASPAARLIHGYAPEELLGRPGFDLIHPDDRPVAKATLAHVLASPGESVPATLHGLTADGRVQTVETTACNRLKDPSVRAVVVNFRDVTEREQAAAELARQHAVLEGLFASVPDVIAYKDADLKLLRCNPAFEALAGRPERELVGKTCGEVFRAPWADRLRAAEREVMATGRILRAQEWVTYPDDRQALLDVVVSPLRTDGGTLTGLITVGRDVTGRHRLEEQLRQVQKMEAVGQLAGGVAHDFNNVLTVILGNLDALRAGAGGDRDALVADTERAARQAADLTGQLLRFARRQPLRPAAVDVNDLVADGIALLRRMIDPRVTVAFRPGDGVRPATADPDQLRQVLLNLCLNARDALPDGGTLTVETANAAALPADAHPEEPPAGRYVRLTVADTGVGMTEEVRGRIFEPFFTTKELGKGTGLGLAVVYGIVRQHGGWIACASAPGRGTRFDVYLPAADTTTPPPAAAAGAKPPAGTQYSALSTRYSEPAAPLRPTDADGPPLVLVADDDAAVRLLARLGLEAAGYRVAEAADGAAAVAAFRSGPRVGVVVLDSDMPGMNGYKAFAAIRELDPAARVLFSSGRRSPDRDPSGPGVDYLDKPYTPTELADAVARLLGEQAPPT